ncbi:hypothetical protein D3C71_2108690 [compost metagenome]
MLGQCRFRTQARRGDHGIDLNAALTIESRANAAVGCRQALELRIQQQMDAHLRQTML